MSSPTADPIALRALTRSSQLSALARGTVEFEDWCPFVRNSAKFGLLIVNPNLPNGRAAGFVGGAILGWGGWFWGTAVAIGLKKQNFRMRLGTARARYGVSQGAKYDGEEKDVPEIIKLARR